MAQGKLVRPHRDLKAKQDAEHEVVQNHEEEADPQGADSDGEPRPEVHESHAMRGKRDEAHEEESRG